MINENTCICCGKSIPEGVQVCPQCDIGNKEMSELNRDQIIKALECFSGNLVKCRECGYLAKHNFPQCKEFAAMDALSLIKELTKENERLIEELAKSYNALDKQMDFYCSFTQSKIQNCPIDDEIAKAKADTVREMQERIAEHATNGYPRKVRLDVVDKIANEVLEGEK